MKYTIDKYDCFLCFLAAESESDIRFSPTGLDFTGHEVTNFRKQYKIKKLFSRNSG